MSTGLAPQPALAEAPAESETGVPHVRALDGARGIAVALVFLFHLNAPGFGDGYLGVDVFFVLSGFLITTLLIAERGSSGRISLRDFWARRARRLLPALVLVLVAVAVFGRLEDTFSQRQSLRGDLLATTAYVANWHLITTSSYFDDTGSASPLQHTWSLAIEEQFYLLWPILLVIAIGVGFRRRPEIAVVILATLLAIASAILLATRWQPDAVERAYMGTDARIFEPLVGALGAALVALPAPRRWIERWGLWLVIGGSAGFVASFAIIRPANASYYDGGAVLLCLSVAAIITGLWAGRGAALGRTLSWKPVAWVGLISYGLYLWHWPILVWLHADSPVDDASLLRKAVAVLLTFAAATLSFYLIERPIRRGRFRFPSRHRVSGKRPLVVVLVVVPVTLLMTAGLSVALTRVAPPTASDHVVMLVGDSVINHLTVPLEQAMGSLGWRVVSGAHGGCSVTGEEMLAPNGNPVPVSEVCPGQAVKDEEAVLRQDDPDVVLWWDRMSVSSFLTANGQKVMGGTPQWWALRRATLAAAVERLSAKGAFIVFVGTEPPGPGIEGPNCGTVERCEWRNYQVQHYFDATARWDALLKRYATQHPKQAAYIDISSAVCKTIASPCDDTVDGVTARPDGVHYEGPGIPLVVNALLERLRPILLGRP